MKKIPEAQAAGRAALEIITRKLRILRDFYQHEMKEQIL